ncbi:hypothetical protein VTP01DRAFT_410, partial [Rhizomucor pusillus]|uniref:uncharacterized protein n=1 Tax=Rhizomucor pusillus TaxID=4840 RepID=UPI0037448FB7
MDVDFEVETAVQSGIDNTQNPEEEQQQQQQQQHTTAESATLPGIGSRKRRKQFDHVRPGTLTKFLCIDEEAMEEYSKGKENFRAKRRAEAESMIWKMTSYQSLTALPSDVHDNWMIKPYPRGRRCFIVAHRGMTFAVNTSGKVWQEFRSTLPGGTEDNSKDGSSLLDCICVLAGKEKRFYILDTLYWKGYDWEQYTAETRQYWLETVVAPELSPSYSEKSRFTFIPLKTIPTSDLPQLLHNPETYFAEKWSDITLDGLVISHKQSQYDTSNPLVFWAAWPLNFAEAVSQE